MVELDTALERDSWLLDFVNCAQSGLNPGDG
jgi:hypothetical protein